jgi:SOS response regulatory protein OraA/RecX
MLAMELRQKGIDDESMQPALQDVDDEALAYQAAQKRAPRFESLEWNEFRKKLTGFLARRGFPYSVITPVVSRIWSETHTQEKNFEEEDTT